MPNLRIKLSGISRSFPLFTIAYLAEIQLKVAADRMKKQKSQPLYELLVKELGEEAVEKMDLQQFSREKLNFLDKERKEQQNRMLQQEKKFDYNVRAVHLEEMLVWKELSDERQASAHALFDQYETRRIDEEIKAREKSLETFQLLTKVKDDAIKFIRSTIQSHAEELKVSKEQWKKKMESVREKTIKKLAKEKMEKCFGISFLNYVWLYLYTNVYLMENEVRCGSVDIRNDPRNAFHQPRRNMKTDEDGKERKLKYRECTILEGDFTISMITRSNLTDDLFPVFENLREITGSILVFQIRGLTSLGRIFPNLRVIGGHSLIMNYALVSNKTRCNKKWWC
uniref:Receptor L-domain domain-containing protein n=1 Tax=Meloidogyne javanica TaxID=6303 RepID=A0A915NCV8_MELJA